MSLSVDNGRDRSINHMKVFEEESKSIDSSVETAWFLSSLPMMFF